MRVGCGILNRTILWYPSSLTQKSANYQRLQSNFVMHVAGRDIGQNWNLILLVLALRLVRGTLKDWRPGSWENDSEMTTITSALGSHDQKVVCFVVSQNLTRKALVYRWLLRLLIGPIGCIFPQFQWITYDVYHLIYRSNLVIAQKNLCINCQLELSARLMVTRSCFKRGKTAAESN